MPHPRSTIKKITLLAYFAQTYSPGSSLTIHCLFHILYLSLLASISGVG